MKIRNGFVSNSSSSSFVIIGVNAESAEDLVEKYPALLDIIKSKIEDEDDLKEFEESEYPTETCAFDEALDSLWDTYSVHRETEDGFLFGVNPGTSLEDITKSFVRIANDLQVPVEDVKLFSGEEYC